MLEYVVFEKYLTSNYGTWRVHEKIVPPWAESKLPIIKTYHKPKPIKIDQSVAPIESKFKEGDMNEKEDNEAEKKAKNEKLITA